MCFVITCLMTLSCLAVFPASGNGGEFDGWYFPPAGSGMEHQDRRLSQEVGLSKDVIEKISAWIAGHPYPYRRNIPSRWALWRHGRLVHVHGDFHETTDVASLRKTWHAMIAGSTIQRGLLPSLDEPISKYVPELTGNDARATWRHVLTQSAGLDYPYGEFPDYPPGTMWTYSDLNLVTLCNAIARLHGKKDYTDQYQEIAAQAYFDAIGMEGWSTRTVMAKEIGTSDGVRFILSLEHMGRLGLLALARGTWNGRELVPRWFVEELETKQTRGMQVNYNGPNDGIMALSPAADQFPESPYGYLTWVNTDGDYFPGADRRWAWGMGAGGNFIFWNHANGLVFAASSIQVKPSDQSLVHILEDAVVAPDPFVMPAPPKTVGRWDRFEAAVTNTKRYSDPFRDVTLNVTYTRPDGGTVNFWGFYDGGDIWRFWFMPDQTGTWAYTARFSDGSDGVSGTFRCTNSTIPGMIAKDASNPVWFGWKNGGHVFIRSFHAGDRFFAANWPRENRTRFLDWLQTNNYNLLSVASHYLNRNTEDRGRGWETPDLWPLNPTEYRRMETILDDLAARRIMVFPFAGFFGQSSNFPVDHQDQELYIRYSLARIGSYWNLLFNVAGPEPNLKNVAPRYQDAMANEDVHRLGRLIKSLDPFGHLLSVHNRTGDDPYRDAEWLDYGTLQGPKTTNLDQLHRGLLESHHPQKPLYAQETLWGNNVFHPHYSPVSLRKNAFVIAMSAAVLNFADMNGNSSSGFSGSMDLPFRNQQSHDIIGAVWDFFETIPWYRLKPRQDLTSDGYCLSEPGQQYLIYLPAGGRFNVQVEGGPYRITWINGQDTNDRRPGGETKTGGPLYAPDDADDWLCWLTAPDLSDQLLPSAPQVIAQGCFPDIAADPQGNVHVVYARNDSLYYRRYDRASDQWQPEESPSFVIQQTSRSDPDIVVDSRGNPHVFAGTHYAWKDGNTWRLLSPPNATRDTELAIDSRDNAYLIHRGGNNGGHVGVQVHRPGATAWEFLADPDKPWQQDSNHVYGDIAIGPGDVLHVIQRKGRPLNTAYRQSIDGGQSWPIQEGITDTQPEAPHIAVDHRGVVWATDGNGHAFRRTSEGWTNEGRILHTPYRGQPELAVDRLNNVFAGCLQGRYNVRNRSGWTGERVMQPVSGRRLAGFVEFAGGQNGAWVTWDEGDAGNGDTGMTGNSVIVVAGVTADGRMVGVQDIR